MPDLTVNGQIFLFERSIAFSMRTADLDHAWAAGTEVSAAFFYPSFLTKNTGHLINVLSTHLLWKPVNNFDGIRQKIISEVAIFQQASWRLCGQAKSWIFTWSPRNQVTEFELPSKSAAVKNLWTGGRSTRLRNRDGNWRCSGMNKDRKCQKKGQDWVVWPSKPRLQEIGLPRSAVHKVNLQTCFLGMSYSLFTCFKHRGIALRKCLFNFTGLLHEYQGN